MDIEKLRTELLEFFPGLIFNEEYHTYSKDGIILTPVTNHIKRYALPFDTMIIAKRSAKKRGLSVEEVLKEWEDKKVASCNLGNSVHKFAETYQKGMEPTIPQERAVIQFFESIPEFIVPVLSEYSLYSTEYKVAGTMDKLFLNTLTGNFMIIDYKTNGDLDKNYMQQRLLYPFNMLLDTPFNKYQIQLSLYQLLFELTGYKVERRRIVWFLDDGTYQIRDTKDFTSILKQVLSC